LFTLSEDKRIQGGETLLDQNLIRYGAFRWFAKYTGLRTGLEHGTSEPGVAVQHGESASKFAEREIKARRGGTRNYGGGVKSTWKKKGRGSERIKVPNKKGEKKAMVKHRGGRRTAAGKRRPITAHAAAQPGVKSTMDLVIITPSRENANGSTS